ncbi:hypothetical protein OJF2_75280 [Aquisphaera giovannonii]|uniref:Macro domain protein n=1 Tax=Aquisphaera giovannonii TaxID=406548 RepID=A0A5B9WE25_9BACT|nr:macro domain-containing protein [Aquisphaera giovannonii]QEH38918.1 hypothetical protein OJF2_75280 [Aquisphaera giovannonii]
MVAQRGVKAAGAGPPIRYEALGECLRKAAEKAAELRASVHMPRIGCGLAGGDWARVGPLIEAAMVARGLEVTVYDPG